MKRYIKIVSLTLISLIILVLCTGCPLLGDSIDGGTTGSTPGNTTPGNGTVDIEPGAVPLARPHATPNVIMPVASNTLTESNENAIIDFSNTSDGYVMVKWLTAMDHDVRVQVTGPSGVAYTYVVFESNVFEVLPLTDGNGSYSIVVVEQVPDGRYALVINVDVNVSLTDEFAPFLRPNQFVYFTETCSVVMKAAELVAENADVLEKIADIYSFVINNIVYDEDFAAAVTRGEHSNYHPDLDAVLANRKGICFDFASLMTAMLRSQGVPTRLVFGFAGSVYHAWISVYSKEAGWIEDVVLFDGSNWMLMDPTFAAAASSAAELQAYIGDGHDYVMTFMY